MGDDATDTEPSLFKKREWKSGGTVVEYKRIAQLSTLEARVRVRS